MLSPDYNGSRQRKSTHPLARHEPDLHTVFRSSPPCSIDAPAAQALHQTAIDAATGICRRIGFEPYREQATLAVHNWHRELQGNIPDSYDAHRPLFPYMYRALTFIIYRMARESGMKRVTQIEFSPLTSDPVAHSSDPAYLAQISELPELVATLPDALRTIIVMRYFDDRSTPEIAKILQITRNAVRLRIHRAIQHLRDNFGLS